MQKSIEIMSPAGNYPTLSAAIKAGADSIYFGVEQLNMRAKSTKNFKISDLSEIVERCKENNVKSYLTLNTVIYDSDLQVMRELVREAKKAGISAIIASDIAAIQYSYEQKVPVHISTQLNISNIEAVRFFSRFANVMVLARELNLHQVKAIYDTIQKEQITGPSGKTIKLEIFAHGALCMAISGKCYLSLHERNSSANRGACQQTCRHGYTVTNRETGYELNIDNQYIMSPKDLSTIDFLDKIVESGISVLKIEGRARPPEYVKTVTEVYKKAAVSVKNKTYTKEKIEIWKTKLQKVFNRGFWDGYYLGKKIGEWSEIYGSKATRKKMFLGNITNFFSKKQVAEIDMKAYDININDEVLIIGPTTGAVNFSIAEIRKELLPVNSAKKGDIISIPVPEKVRRADKLYKLQKTKYSKNAKNI